MINQIHGQNTKPKYGRKTEKTHGTEQIRKLLARMKIPHHYEYCTT
jgi:hypothetical protein